uniref:SFRICE_021207 n=1 Tax=Spodoptera frugiperda TaxID=7108 RepID=A0A2H1VS02_SPOFR
MSNPIPVTVVTTVSGATLLILNGYSFTNPAPMAGGERWFCSGRIRWKCNVCLCVNDDYELRVEGDVNVDRVGETHRYSVCDHGVVIGNISSYAQSDRTTSMVEPDTVEALAIEAVTIETVEQPVESLEGVGLVDADTQVSQEFEEKYDIETKEEAIVEGVDGVSNNVALLVESRRGKTVLQYNGHRYRQAYKSKSGTRWNCSVNKHCTAFLFINDQDEILMSYEEHDHQRPTRFENVDADQSDTAVVITSRKGKEMLLFRKFTYRKQYDKGNRSRWVCSTLKNCRGCVFTDNNNYIISAFEEHCHNPPKYYLKPDHLIGALREPLIIETD